MEDPVSPTASMASLWEASSATSEDSGNLYDDLDSPCGSESEVSDSDIFQELGVLGNIEEELPAYKENVKKAQEGTDIEEDPNDRTICESTASHQDAPNQGSDTAPQTAREETKKKEKTENSLRNGTLVSENSTKNNVPPDSPNTRSKMRKLREEEKAKKSIRKLTLESQAKERNRKDGCLSEQGDGRQRGGQTKDPDQDTPLTLPLASKNKDLQFILSRVMKNRSSTERKEPIPPHQELNPESGVCAEKESEENNSVLQVNGGSSLERRAKEKKKEREGHTVETDSRGCVAREPVSEVYGRGGLFTVVKEKERKNEVRAMETDGGSCVTGEAAEARELPGPAVSEPPNSNTSSLVNKIMSIAGFSQRLTAADFMPEVNTVKKYKIPKVSKESKKMKSSKGEEGNELDLFEDVLVGQDRDELMKEIQKLKIERDSLQQSLHTSQERCSGLEKDNEVILKNMSALWKTSMAQLRQKTVEVATAKREKEAIIFRRAMRQVPRDELDRVVSHIAAYDKEEFAEFVSKLREKDEDSEMKECTCGRGTPGARKIGTVAQRVREAALGSRVTPSSDSKAQTLKTLLGRKGETVTHSEEKPESWSKRRGLTRSPKSQRRLFGSESNPPESEGSRSIWDRLGRNPLDRRKSGIEDERKERHAEKGRGASEEVGSRKRTEKGRDGGEEFGSRKHTEKGRGASEEFGSRKHTEKGRDAGEERASKTPSSESTGGKRKSVFSRLSIKRTVHNQEESAGVYNSSGVPDSHPDSEISQEKTGKRSEARRTVTPGDQHVAKARSSESCLTEPSKGISTPLSKPLDVTPSPSLKPDWTDMALSAQEPEVEPEYCPDEEEEEEMLSKTLFGQRMRRKMEKLRKQSQASKPLRDVPVLSSPVLSQDKSSEATQKQKQPPLQDDVGSVTNNPATNTSKPVSVEPKDVDIVTSRALVKGETAAKSPRNIRKLVSVESKSVDTVTNRTLEDKPAANSPRNIKKSVSVESKSVDTVTNKALEGEPAANSPRRSTRKSQSAESKSVDTVTNRDEGDMIRETLKHDIQKGKEPVEDAESRMRKSQSSVQKGSDKEKTEGLREADILRVKKVEESTKKRRNSENNSVAVNKSGRRHEDDIEQNPETVKEGNESVSKEQVTESAEKGGTRVNNDVGVKESRRGHKDDLEQNPGNTKEGKESLTNEQVMESAEKTLTTKHKPKQESGRVEKPNCEDIDSEEINNAILSLAKLRSAFHSEERKLRTKGNRLRKQKHLSLFGGDDSSDEGEVTVGEACKENQGTETCHNASVGNVATAENTEIEGNEKNESVDLLDVNTHISREMEALLDMVENAYCENFNVETKQVEKSVAESSTKHIRKGPNKRGLEEMETSKVTHQVQVQEPASEEVEITDKRRRSRLLKKASAPNNTKDLKETVTSRVPHQGQVQEAPSERVEVSDKKERGRSLKKGSASHTEEEEERSTEKEPKPAEDKNTDKVPVKRAKFKKEPSKKDKEGSARKNDNQQVKETPERERSRNTDEEETTEGRKTEDQTRKADRQTRARTKVDSREEDEGKKVDQPRRERRKTGLREGDEKRKVDEEINEGKKTRREESEGRNNIDQLKRERRKTGSREENEETKTNSIEEDERKQRRERRKTGSREENEETKTNSTEENERKQRRERRKTGSREENEKRKVDEESTDPTQEDDRRQRRERRKTGSREENEKRKIDEESTDSTQEDDRRQRREGRKTGLREVEKRKIDEQTEDSTKIDSTEEDERLQRRERRKTGSREGEDKKKVDEETKGSTDVTEEDERLQRRERRKTNPKEEKEKRKVNEQIKECTEADPMEEDERKQRRERRKTGSREKDEKRKVNEQIKESTKTDAAEEDERKQRRERRKTISMEENDQAKESSVTDLTEEHESKKMRERRKTGSRNEDKSTNVDHQSKEATETDTNEGEESATTCQHTQAKEAPSHKRLKDNKPPEHENAAEIPEDSTWSSQNKDEGRRATSRKDSSREKDICKTRKSKRTTKGKSDESADGVRSSKQLRGKRVEAPSCTPTPDTSGGLGSIDEVGANAVDGMSFNPRTEDRGAGTASSKTETMTFKPQTGDNGAESVSSATSTVVLKPPTEDHEAESVSSASFKSRTEDHELENSSLKMDTLTFKPQTEDHKTENASKVIDSVSYKPQQTEGHEAENPSSKTDTKAVQEQRDHQTNKDNSTAKENKRPIEDNRQGTREPDAQKEKVTEGSIEAKENEQSTSEEPQTKLNTNMAGGKNPIKSTRGSDIPAVDPTEGASKDTTEEDSQETDILTSLLGTNYDEDSLFYQEEELLYDEGSEDEENTPKDENESEGRKEHKESPISKTDTKKHDREDERNREGLEKETREVDKSSNRDEDRDLSTGNSTQEDSAPKPGDKASHTTLPFLNTPSQKLKLPGGRIKKLTTSPRDKGSRGIEEGVSPLLVREGRRGEKPEVRSSRSEGVSPRSQGNRKDSPERGRRTREARSSHVLLSQNRKSPPRVRESRQGSRKRERESEAESPGKRERSPKRSPKTRGERSSPRQREIVDEREQPASKRRRLSVKSRLTFLHNSDEENITRPSRRQSSTLEAERTRTSSRHRNQSGEKRPAADPHAHTHTRESSQQDGAQLSSLTDGKPKILTSAVPVDSKLLQSVLAQSPSKLMAQGDEKEEGELDDEEEEEGEDCSDRKARDSEKMKPSDGKRQTEVLKKDTDRNKTKRSSKERQNVSPDNRDTQGGKAGKADKQNTSLSTSKEDAKLGDAETSIHHNQTHHKQASQERQRHKSGGAVERVNSPRASQRIRNSSSNHQQTSQAKPPPCRKKLALSETLPDHETEEPRRNGRGAAEHASTIKEGETHRKSCNPRNENALRKRSPLLEPLPEYEIEKPKRTRKEASEFASAIEEEDQKRKSRTPKNKYGQRKQSPLSEAFEDQEETEKALELYASSVQEEDQKHKSRTPRNKNAPRKKSPLSELFEDQHGTEKAIEEENRKSKRLSPRKENALRKKSPILEALPDPEHLLDTEEEHQKQRKTQAPLNEKESRKNALRDQGIEAPTRDGKGDLERIEKAEQGEPRKRSSCAPMDENATFYPGDLYQAMHVKVKAPFRKDQSASSVSSLSDDTIDLMVKQHNEKFSDVTNASDDSETSLLKYIADDDDDNDGDDESESDEEINVDAVEEKEPNRDGAREDEEEMEFEDDGKQIELCDSDEESETEEEGDADGDVRAADENRTYGSDERKEGEIEYKDDRKQSEIYSSDHESESEEEIVVDDFDAGGETKTHQTNERENEGETQHKDNTTGQNKGSRGMNQDTKRPTLEHGEAATTAHPTSPYQRDTTPRDECESEDESSSTTSPESAPGVGERNSVTPVFTESRQRESDSDEDGSESRSTRDTPTPASATHHSDSEEEEECSREGNTATPDSPVSAAHHSDVEIGNEDQNSLSPVSEMHHSDSEEEEGTREWNTRNTPTPASVTRHSNIEEGGSENQNSLSPVSEMHHSDSEEEEDSRERNTLNTTTPASAMHHSDSEEGSENQNSLSSVSEMQHSYSEGSSREQNTQTPVTEARCSNSEEEEEEEDCSEGSVHSATDNILPDTSEDEDMSSSEESELDVETVDSEPEQPGKEVQQSGLPETVPLDHQSSDGLKDTDDTESATELATGLTTEPLDEGRVTAETQDAANNSSSSDDSDSDSDCQCSDCRSSSSSSSSSGSDSSSSSSSDSEEESAVVNEVEGVERPNPTGEDVEEESHDQPSSHSYTDPPTQAVDKPKSPNETGHKTPRKTPKKTPKKTPCKTPNAKLEGSQNSTTPFKKTPRKSPCKRTPCKKSPLKKAQGKVTKERRAPVCPAASPVKEPQATSLASPVDENCVDDSDEAVDDTRSLSPRNTQPRKTTRIPSPSNTQSRIPCAQNTQSGLDAETPLGRQVMRESEGPGKTQKSTTTPASGCGSSQSKGCLRQVTPLPDVSNSQSFQLKQKISPLDSSPTRKTFYVKRRVSSLRVANAAPSMPLIDTGIVPVKARSTVATSPSRTVKLSCSNESPVISVVHSRQDEESHSPQRPAARSPKKMAQEVKVPTPTGNNPVTAKKRQRPPSPVLCDARNSSGKRLRTLSPSMYNSVSPRKLFSDATNVKQTGTVTHPNPESSSGPSEPCTKASISDVVVPVTIRRAKRQLNLQSSTSPAKQFSFISISDQDSASPTGLREGGTPGQVLRKSPRKPKRVAKLNL